MGARALSAAGGRGGGGARGGRCGRHGRRLNDRAPRCQTAPGALAVAVAVAFPFPPNHGAPFSRILANASRKSAQNASPVIDSGGDADVTIGHGLLERLGRHALARIRGHYPIDQRAARRSTIDRQRRIGRDELLPAHLALEIDGDIERRCR
ncbi:hypothetical protein WJ15_13835 [Burkholderia cepacia]|nr:hypothetical protein WJ15_13835 [Burkholderia cepacia]